jgi:hypothetical protein
VSASFFLPSGVNSNWCLYVFLYEKDEMDVARNIKYAHTIPA